MHISASDAAKASQDAPRRPQDSPETPQKTPKTLQDALWTSPRRPKTLPGGPKDTPKGRKIQIRERMSSRQGSQGPLGAQLRPQPGSILAASWPFEEPLGSQHGPNLGPRGALGAPKGLPWPPKGLISRTDAAQSTPATKHIMMTASIKLIHGGRGRRQRRSL